MDKCEGCLCDTCVNMCQGCPSCLNAEYSKSDWINLKMLECENFEGVK